jgi:predicted hydrocarbon binding protein
MTEALRTYPPSLLRQFILTTMAEVGRSELGQVIDDPSLLDLNRVSSLSGLRAGETYARIQQLLRVYYGRGARGIFLRIGQNLWGPILHEQSIVDRALAAGVKAVPVGSSQKLVLDLLAKIMRGGDGSVSVHTLDLNLLFVDSSSPATVGLSEPQPVCFVTQGLVRGALYWATGRNYEVGETRCRAMGSSACEFKIVASGK